MMFCCTSHRLWEELMFCRLLLVYLWILTSYSIFKKHQWAQKWLGYSHRCPFASTTQTVKIHWPTLRHAFHTLYIIFIVIHMASDTKLHSRCTTLIYACYQILRFYREGLCYHTTIIYDTTNHKIRHNLLNIRQ